MFKQPSKALSQIKKGKKMSKGCSSVAEQPWVQCPCRLLVLVDFQEFKDSRVPTPLHQPPPKMHNASDGHGFEYFQLYWKHCRFHGGFSSRHLRGRSNGTLAGDAARWHVEVAPASSCTSLHILFLEASC